MIILLITVGLFAYFFATNATIRHELSQTSLSIVALLLLLYVGTIAALMMVTAAALRLCHVQLTKRDNLLLNAYTTVINFFGPLQSGPAFRAVYLKRKYHLDLKKYAVATLAYYLFFALISGVFLLSGVLKWWLIPLILLSLLGIYSLRRQHYVAQRLRAVDLRGWYYLAGATLVQLSLVATIYYIELHTLSPNITLSQAIIYTGAANFALFVSLTPGAIGFRETFLVFTKHLHHISNNLIISANILDRAMYLLLLLLLAVFLLLTHGRNQLTPKDP